MEKPTIYLFPDTNFFEQFRTTDGCEWTDLDIAGVKLSRLDTVAILITRATRRELDPHKEAGNSRRARRARKVCSLLRDAEKALNDIHIIREKEPRVTIAAAPWVPRIPAHTDLDVSQPDDAIVQDVLAQRNAFEGRRIVFVSDDGNAIATARHVGLDVAYVPDSWRLAPEPDAIEREVQALRQRLDKLESQSTPTIELGLNGEGPLPSNPLLLRSAADCLLNDYELSRITRLIEDAFPEESFFSEDDQSSKIPTFMHEHRSYFQLRPESIKKYIEKRVQWKRDIDLQIRRLASMILAFESSIEHVLSIQNSGSMPARNVRIRIEAKGSSPLSISHGKNDIEKRPEDIFQLLHPPTRPTPLDYLGATGAWILPPTIGERTRPAVERDKYRFYWRDCPVGALHVLEAECQEISQLTSVDLPFYLSAIVSGLEASDLTTIEISVWADGLLQPEKKEYKVRPVPYLLDLPTLTETIVQTAVAGLISRQA